MSGGEGGELCKLQKEHGQHDVIPVPDGCLWEVSLMIGMISVLYTVVSCMNDDLFCIICLKFSGLCQIFRCVKFSGDLCRKFQALFSTQKLTVLISK